MKAINKSKINELREYIVYRTGLDVEKVDRLPPMKLVSGYDNYPKEKFDQVYRIALIHANKFMDFYKKTV